MSEQVGTSVLALTADIVTVHVRGNRVATEELPALIESVYRSLKTAGESVPVKKLPARHARGAKG